MGRLPSRLLEPDLPWGGLGFTFETDSQILAGRTEGLTINNMAMSSLNKGGTFNVAMTVASELDPINYPHPHPNPNNPNPNPSPNPDPNPEPEP